MINSHGISPSSPQRELPIGLFDSGVGGMTVLRAMREQLPNESFLYLGDTARMPYGTKSVETVQKYALEAAAKLVELIEHPKTALIDRIIIPGKLLPGETVQALNNHV